MKEKRSRLEIAKSILRISQEPRIPIRDLRELAQVSEKALVSWARFGRRGVYLDAVKKKGEWFSNREAVLRFLEERAANDARLGMVQAK